MFFKFDCFQMRRNMIHENRNLLTTHRRLDHHNCQYRADGEDDAIVQHASAQQRPYNRVLASRFAPD